MGLKIKVHWWNATHLGKLKRTLYLDNIWIHLMQNIFRNQSVKKLTILDNPLKMLSFVKVFIKFLWNPYEALTSWQLYHVMGCTSIPIKFCTQIITNFQLSWKWVQAVDQIHSKMHTDSYLPHRQTWCNKQREFVVYVPEFFKDICVHYHWWVCAPMTCIELPTWWGWHKHFHRI